MKSAAKILRVAEATSSETEWFFSSRVMRLSVKAISRLVMLMNREMARDKAFATIIPLPHSLHSALPDAGNFSANTFRLKEANLLEQ